MSISTARRMTVARTLEDVGVDAAAADERLQAKLLVKTQDAAH